MRLAGDAHQIAYRGRTGEQHRIEAAGFDGFSGVGVRGGGANRPIGSDLLHLPAQLGQANVQRIGGHIRARYEHPVDGIEQVVIGGKFRHQSLTCLFGRGHEIGTDTPTLQDSLGCWPDGGDPQPGKRPGVQTVAGEFLQDCLRRMLTGQHDPAEPAVHDAVDRLLHRLGVTRWFHLHRGHLVMSAAVLGQATQHGPGGFAGGGQQHPPAGQWLGFKPVELRVTSGRRAENHEHLLRLWLQTLGGVGQPVQSQAAAALQRRAAAEGEQHPLGTAAAGSLDGGDQGRNVRAGAPNDY